MIARRLLVLLWWVASATVSVLVWGPWDVFEPSDPHNRIVATLKRGNHAPIMWRRQDSSFWQRAHGEQTFPTYAVVAVGPHGYAELELVGGRVLSLGPHTQVMLTASTQDDEAHLVTLLRGAVRVARDPHSQKGPPLLLSANKKLIDPLAIGVADGPQVPVPEVALKAKQAPSAAPGPFLELSWAPGTGAPKFEPTQRLYGDEPTQGKSGSPLPHNAIVVLRATPSSSPAVPGAASAEPIPPSQAATSAPLGPSPCVREPPRPGPVVLAIAIVTLEQKIQNKSHVEQGFTCWKTLAPEATSAQAPPWDLVVFARNHAFAQSLNAVASGVTNAWVGQQLPRLPGPRVVLLRGTDVVAHVQGGWATSRTHLRSLCQVAGCDLAFVGDEKSLIGNDVSEKKIQEIVREKKDVYLLGNGKFVRVNHQLLRSVGAARQLLATSGRPLFLQPVGILFRK